MLFYHIRKFFLCPPVIIGEICLGLASFCILSGYLPTHDAINLHGGYHYFYNSIGKGVIPYWNPYSQTGTPFFINFQGWGLLLPSQFICILFQKLTGCTTLTTYIIHYFLLYYIFIVGAFYTFRLFTRHNIISLIFSVILLCATFPIFMRQFVSVFFSIPLLTFFLLSFFQETLSNKKGLFLFVASFLFGISLNSYIPIWLLFYLPLLVILLFLCKIADVKQTFRFFINKVGRRWLLMSLLLVLLLSTPMLALYYEFRFSSEHFPTVRFLQRNGNNLVKLFASDMSKGIFSADFTNDMKVSLTRGNLLGLLFEPFQYFFYDVQQSTFYIAEIVLYPGIFLLPWIWIALKKGQNRYAYIWGIIAGLTLCIACNFQDAPHAKMNITQRIMVKFFPFLAMSDVFEYGGILFIWCLVMLGALGLQQLLKEKHNAFLMKVSFFLLGYKYIVFLPLVISYYLYFSYIQNFWFILCVLLVCSILLLLYIYYQFHHQVQSSISRGRLLGIAIVLFGLDLLLFDVMHVVSLNHVLDKKYSNYLQRSHLLQQNEDASFINYRIPFSPEEANHFDDPFFSNNIYFNAFLGHEIYAGKKAAFPLVVKAMQSGQTMAPYLAQWDHNTMTTYYYDYLVNVAYHRFPITSNMITPILNFFPKANVIFVGNKYDVVGRINQSSLDDLRTHIFIEQDRTIHRPGLEASQFFKPENYVKYTPAELSNFNRNVHRQYAGNSDVRINIVAYDINQLSVSVETPYDGYLYFGDGYSKHWKAFVDGKPTKIEKTNINFKSVYTSAGKHQVQFVFDPVLFRYSLYAYCFGNVLFVISCATHFLTRRKHTR